PTYEVRQSVYEGLSDRAFADHFDEITALADHVSFFPTWREHGFHQVWLKERVRPAHDGALPTLPPELFGARLATRDLHPIPGMSAEACTPQRGVVGTWHARLPHFRMELTPSAGEELQSEYFVDRRDVVDAYTALEPLRPQIAPLIQVGEIRT